MPRYKLTVAYEGTDFHGWQRQEPPDAAPLRTVQGTLEKTVRDVVREPVEVRGASRTDAGVHAVGQTAAFTCSLELEPARMAMAINARLPEDVQVVEATRVVETFDPIGDCVSKGYRYRIKHGCTGGVLPPLFGRSVLWWTAERLDVDRMIAATPHLIGEHDFAGFAKAGHGRESTVRIVHDCSLVPTDEHHVHLDVTGNGFLYHMVRIIAGTLVDVGRGRIEPEDLETTIAARDRSRAGPTLPAHGLCLMWMTYRPGSDAPPPIATDPTPAPDA